MIHFLKNIEFKYFPILGIIAYIPFHLLEEAIGDFPYWMSTHYNLPKVLSYPHWLINNGIFFVVLLLGLFVFLKNTKKNLAFGIGIVIWIFLNSIEHIAFSFLDQKASPGIFTAFFFLLISVLGFIKLNMEKVSPKTILKSILVGIAYWVIPIGIIVLVGSYLVKIFP